MVTQDLALGGRRVLEIADERGAYCGKLLADMGADVLKIEMPGGDPSRLVPPFLQDRCDAESGLQFLYLNSNKRGVTLDITRPKGQLLLRKLAESADILIETYPPGYLDSLGLGYEDLSSINQGLIYTSITGFGQTGPYKNNQSNDLVAMAMGGFMYVTGYAEDSPVKLAGSQSNIMASVYAAASTTIALYYRSKTGIGQHVDMSTQEAVVSVGNICGVGKYLAENIVPHRYGSTQFQAVPCNAYKCKDGIIFVMVNRPTHWKTLARWIHEVTGNADVLDLMFEGPGANRQGYRELLDFWIGEFTAHFTVDELYHEAQRKHLAFTPLSTAASLARDPQLAARGYFVEVQDRQGGKLRYPGGPYRLTETPWRFRRAAPRIGEHNEEVFCGELGLSLGQLTEMQADVIV